MEPMNECVLKTGQLVRASFNLYTRLFDQDLILSRLLFSVGESVFVPMGSVLVYIGFYDYCDYSTCAPLHVFLWHGMMVKTTVRCFERVECLS